jgi:hypothetical protein
MVALLMMGILALLGFLSVSHEIPGIVPSPPHAGPRRRPGRSPGPSAPTESSAGAKLLVEKS